MLKPVAVYYEHCDSDWKVTRSVIANHLLLFITDGTMVYVIDDQPYTLHKGDALYVPKGAMRSAHHIGGQKHEMYVLHFHYEPDSVSLPLLEEGAGRQAAIPNESYFKQRCSLLTQQWLRKNTYYPVTCHCILLELMTLLNIEITHREDPAVNELVIQIQEYITKHYRDKITLEQLSSVVERTPSYISSLFRQVTGQTITDYTQQIRLAAARDLLTNTQMSIGEISNVLGFCEQSYFNKVFKKAIGVPPSAFIRENHRGNHYPSTAGQTDGGQQKEHPG